MDNKEKAKQLTEVPEVVIRSMHERAVELSGRAEETWPDLGKTLQHLHDQKLYRRLGFRTWKSYMESSGLKIKERASHYIMEAARSPLLDRIKHLPYTVALQASKVNPEDLDSFLEKFTQLSQRDRWLIVSRQEGEDAHLMRLLKKKKRLEEQIRTIDREVEGLLASMTKAKKQEKNEFTKSDETQSE